MVKINYSYKFIEALEKLQGFFIFTIYEFKKPLFYRLMQINYFKMPENETDIIHHQNGISCVLTYLNPLRNRIALIFL